ncbi:DUF4225 domain-containing protein [Pseudomonas sp. LS1212]|uniref:DUF4225 domain-containing protein n=1 Tax=Pseudomonas sp. LS1212 TaxID=2972478 RepID=UPI00215B7EC4|nr:DUF4225 domain-containing protein [Pseudomonas sp. LS1212]UVJ43860.1 DUF4225 domain-containing protein [Pseudomonas sp. LS1212]
MNEQSCDIHDVVKSASDLVALGCTAGATNFHDGITQIQFNSIVSNYVNEVINDVNDGVISAWEGVQEIREEHAELEAKVLFYAGNGVGIVAGVIQVEVGLAASAGTGGLATGGGLALVAHGVNNIYESATNIYNGPAALGTTGPVRRFYQIFSRGSYEGNMAYYSMDLILSGFGMIRPVRKPDSVQLFNHDPINHEMAYRQASKLALYFEALVDSLTINAMIKEEEPKAEAK